MKTMVFGASPRYYRFSHKATLLLQELGFEVVPIGIHQGMIGGQPIVDLNQEPLLSEIHTISIYLNPVNQREWYRYIQDLKPQRVIFNPGSENPELYKILQDDGINHLEACTLVMLSVGSFA